MASLVSLIQQLRSDDLLHDEGLQRALLATDQRHFCAGAAQRFCETDVPLPQGSRGGAVRSIAPLSTLALLLEQAAPKAGAGPVLVLGSDGGYSGYVLSEWLSPAAVVVVEADPDLVALTRTRLGARPPRGDMVIARRDPWGGHPDHGPYQAIVVLGALAELPRTLVQQLAPSGLLVAAVGSQGEQPLLVYEAPPEGESAPSRPDAPAAGSADEALFTAEEVRSFGSSGITHVVAFPPLPRSVDAAQPWQPDLTVREVVDAAWQFRLSDDHQGPFLAQSAKGMRIFEHPHPDLALPGLSPRKDAMAIMELAYLFQMLQQYRTATDLYELSLSVLPTSEAHTFLGWAHSFQGRYDRAIEECHKAIAADPTLGNPYNDLGAYHIERGQLEEAIPWLQKATKAPRYDSPFFAHANLGRVHLMLGQVDEARRELLRALEQNPQYPLAKALLKELDQTLQQVEEEERGESE